MFKRASVVLSTAALFACGGPATKTDAEYKREVSAAMKSQILGEITALKNAAIELRDAAPAGAAWNPTTHAADVTKLKAAWKKARTAYEHTEGAIAPIFPDTDAAIDERYDGFLETLGAAGDQNLFDDQGVTGMHAIERILFSDTTPANVKEAEMAIPGYKAPAFPSSATEADDFKTKLATKLVTDCTQLEKQWSEANLDLPAAYQGLVDLMLEQREKVNNAAAGFEESRYAQVTMTDLRNNYEGTLATWNLFKPWAETKTEGQAIVTQLATSFGDLKKAYDAVQGEAIPAPPATWSAEMPSAADLATPFGTLYGKVREATDEKKAGSVVDQLTKAGALFSLTSGT